MLRLFMYVHFVENNLHFIFRAVTH